MSWCGMRGLVTLATALALPAEFPGRDVIVLSAFVVVLGTLILQGFTIRPLIAWLRIAPDNSLDAEVARARSELLDAALKELSGASGEAADAVRSEYRAARAASAGRLKPSTVYDELRTRALDAERRLLMEKRNAGSIDDDAYHMLEDELDRAELNIASIASTSLEG